VYLIENVIVHVSARFIATVRFGVLGASAVKVAYVKHKVSA
jgi:hypothetical protein